MKMPDQEPKNILLGEDDDDDYMLFEMAVEELTFAVVLTRAENGEVLFRILEQKHPDILFLDLLMPCKNGRECLKEIRSNRKYDNIPIIVYTSLEDLSNIEFCYREGGNLYAVKPASLGDLKTMLEKVFAIDWKKALYYPPLSQFVLNPQ